MGMNDIGVIHRFQQRPDWRLRIVNLMRTVGKLTIFGAVAAAGAIFLSSPAAADPNGPPPCEGPLGFVCSMVPMMPDLEGDLDLTQQQPPATIDAENQLPADVCAMGCV